MAEFTGRNFADALVYLKEYPVGSGSGELLSAPKLPALGVMVRQGSNATELLLGQSTMQFSLPITFASDQTPLTVNFGTTGSAAAPVVVRGVETGHSFARATTPATVGAGNWTPFPNVPCTSVLVNNISDVAIAIRRTTATAEANTFVIGPGQPLEFPCTNAINYEIQRLDQATVATPVTVYLSCVTRQ